MDDITIKVSDFQGYENDILQVRNRNRESEKEVEDIIWRYQGQKKVLRSDIFWAEQEGQKVGMAAVIHRPYHILGEEKHLLVLGDISLDHHLRGTGVADQLFSCIQEKYSTEGAVGFVFPTKAAEKVLKRTGWSYLEPLIHNVLLISPEKKITTLLKVEKLAKIACSLIRSLLKLRLWLVPSPGYSMRDESGFSTQFDQFFTRLDKSKLVCADKSSASLKWRYSEDHFGEKSIVSFWKDDEMIGFCIYRIGSDGDVCSVFDLLCISTQHVMACMKLLIHKMILDGRSSIRIMMNSSHQYAPVIRKLGFIPRDEGNSIYVFQFHSIAAENDLQIMFTAADKDV